MKKQLQDLYLKAKDGDRDALQTYIEFKLLLKDLTEMTKDLEQEAIEEASKHGKGQHELHGALIMVKNSASRWDFAPCTEVSSMEDKLKALKDSLKKIAEGGGVALDEETGEVKPLPIKLHGKEIVEVRGLKTS